jgi:hypothetical protein
MQEITEKDQLAAGVPRQQIVQLAQVGVGGAVGHGLAQAPVGCGLAEMYICYQQRLLLRPVDGLFRKQPERTAGQFDGLVRIHARHGRAEAGVMGRVSAS